MLSISRITHYRTNHGFGVHSPFAYHFITRVLREKLPFYDFADRVTAPDDRLLYRVMNFFQPATVCMLGADKSALIHMVLPRAQMVTSPAEAEMTVAWGDATELPGSCPLLFAVGRRVKTQWKELPGMKFSNGNVGIAVNRSGLPHQDFKLSF
jgi:hypothetical protein